MILTVSPNPALDRVHVVRGFQPGRQCRAILSFLQPGGSGIHASEVIQAFGGTSVALGLLGGYTGNLWQAEATRRKLVSDMVDIQGETRQSFCLIDLNMGNIVESVEDGPRVSADCLPALLGRLDPYLSRATMLVLSGSLPPGFPSTGYRDMVDLAHRYHVPVVADLHGEQLRMILGQKPWLIKPSLTEFDELVGHTTSDLPERAQLSASICRETGIIIALSMSAEGLLLTGPDGQWLLKPPSVECRLPDGLGINVIGCGDALVGALSFEYCETRDLLSAVRLGMAAAYYNLGTFGVPEIDAKRTRRLAPLVDVQTYEDGQAT